MGPVCPALKEPLPGWVDNMNGPTGVMIGAAKGVIRSMLCDGDCQSELIPVDHAINGIICIAYQTATAEKKPSEIPVYNITAPDYRKVSWKKIMNIGKAIGYEYPFEAGLWYPDGNITTNKLWHYINLIFFMWLPAYLIDFLLLIAGQKRFMIRVQNKIATGLEVLQFFTMRNWDFKSANYEEVWKKLNDQDKEIFNMDVDCIDDTEYMKIGVLGGRQYIMKEPLSTIPKARRQLMALYILDRVCKTVIIGMFFYWILKKTGILQAILSGLGYEMIVA